MNISLFFDLHKLVNMPSNFSISEENFFLFLLGGYYDENLYDINKVSGYLNECKVQPDKKLELILGRKYKKTLKLHYEGSITLDGLIMTKCETVNDLFKAIKKKLLNCNNEIACLYDKYSISIPQNDKMDKAISRLFSLCIVDRAPRLFASYKNLKMKPVTYNATLGRGRDATNLHSTLNQYHKIIVSGQYGTGKTHFINYCLYSWDLDDYCIIPYETDLKSTLNKIRYRDINGYEYSDASNNSLFNENYSSSLLIIDNMYFSPDLSKELAYLADMKINIIIITLNDISYENIGCFYNCQLPSLSNEIIYKIFECSSGLPLKDENQKELLSKLTLDNVLLVSLIAFQCKKLAKETINSDTSDIIDQVLNELITLNNHMNLASSTNITFKHPYDGYPLDFIGHVKKVYASINKISEQAFVNTNYDTIMRQLCCFGWSPIPHKFILSVLPFCDLHKFRELSELGLITLTEEAIQLSPLISRAVYANGVSPAEYDSLVENIVKFLREYEQTLDTPYLSDILFTFFNSLYKEVREKNNPNQESTASQFDNWQELAYLITTYYNQTGNLELSKKLINLVKYPDSLKNGHNALDKPLIEISNKMQMLSESENMVSSIDDLIRDLDDFQASDDSPTKTNLYLSSTINMTSIIINALDTTLNQLCLLILELHINPQNNCLIPLRILVFTRLIQTINSNKLYHQTLFYDEQCCFYNGCCWLITQKDVSKTDLEESLTKINKWNNLNYRIRGLAFIIFWESNWSYEKYDKDLFITSTIPAINKLKELIQNCMLIPIQTYRLCLYAYIEAAITQYTFIQHKELDIAGSPNFFSQEIFYDLFKRCNLTKHDLEEITLHIEHIFSLMENIVPT